MNAKCSSINAVQLKSLSTLALCFESASEIVSVTVVSREISLSIGRNNSSESSGKRFGFWRMSLKVQMKMVKSYLSFITFKSIALYLQRVFIKDVTKVFEGFIGFLSCASRGICWRLKGVALVNRTSSGL